MFVDTHCHVGFPGYGDALAPTLARSREAGVTRLVCVGIDLETSRRAVEIARGQPGVWAAVGLHPHNAHTMSPTLLAALEELCAEPKVVAVGETGLDTFKNRAPIGAQVASFEAQLGLAQRVGKPIVIHCRDAHARCREVLRAVPPPSGVIHCFTGTRADAVAYRALDMVLSFSGIVTYRSAKELQEAAREAPEGSFVLETDAPFLAPRPPGGRLNQPANLPYTAQKIAELRGVTVPELARATSRAAERLFGLGDERL